MKNQVFQAQSETDVRRKLEVVLRQIAGDRLTEKQRRQIAAAVGYRQYRFRFTQAPGLLPEVRDTADGQAVIRLIFGDLRGLARGPTAVLVRGCGEEENTVYLYLPREKEEPRDESRKEEADSQ